MNSGFKYADSSCQKVNLFIVGAAKCGTTSLFQYLSQVPEVFTTKPKEPRYFATDIPERHRIIKTIDDYHSLYFDAGTRYRYLIDASPAYMYSKTASQEIYNYNPYAKIVIMLRPPADLLYSLHSQYLWSCDENIEDFSEAWAMSSIREQGGRIPNGCRNPFVLVYNKFALLGDQVERYFSIFPREQIHTILLSDMKEDVGGCFSKLLLFLGLEREVDIDFKPRNVNTYHKSKLLSLIIHGKYPFIKWLSKYVSLSNNSLVKKTRRALNHMNNDIRRRPPLPLDTRKEIEAHYEGDVKKLEKLIHADLSDWRTIPPAQPY